MTLKIIESVTPLLQKGVEDIIAYQYDKLTLRNQQILKIASVIAEQSPVFPFKLLKSVIGSFSQSSIADRNELYGVLLSEPMRRFLRVVVTGDGGDLVAIADTNKAAETIAEESCRVGIEEMMLVTFASSSHQQAVFELILENRLERIHGKVALCIESDLLNRLSNSSKNFESLHQAEAPSVLLWESLGFHWQMSKAFGHALICYFNAGKALDAAQMFN